MCQRGWCAGLLVFGLGSAWGVPVAPEGPLAGLVGVRVLLGARDTEPTDYRGTVGIEPGRIIAAEGYDFRRGDRIETTGEFSLSTRRREPRNANERQRGRENMPVTPNGFVLTLADTTADSTLILTLPAGVERIPLAALERGTVRRAEGAVQVDRVMVSTEVAGGDGCDDMPAAAVAPDGTIYVAYITFTPYEGWQRLRQLEAAPERFDEWAARPGGDQLWLVWRREGSWSDPVALTEPGLDLFRPAVAVAGDGTPWVFWSQQLGADDTYVGGDWELLARRAGPGEPGPVVRLSEEPAADIFPSAATTADGWVWVAWMAIRGGNSRILAARQEGAGFGRPEVVADTPANEWTPCLAAGPDGALAVVWDTYEKGDYDVYARFRRGEGWGEPVAVAGSLRGEMNPHAAFDATGRLWVVYESSPEGWGKDFGALEKAGAPLQQGRSVEARVIEGGRVYAPRQALEDAFPGRGPRADRRVYVVGALPRVGVDGAGRIWVTARLKVPNNVAPVGTVWYTYATTYLGETWSPATVVSGTDGTLDARPALVPTTSGLVAISMSDGRHYQRRRQGGIDENIYEALLTTGGANEPQLDPVADPIVAMAEESSEPNDISRLRAERLDLNGRTLQILRGEFHRHTEISPDGGGDGSLLDMWRYARDAADLDWIGNGDHDNGSGREYSWWLTQKTTTIFSDPPHFVPMFTYERSVNYPDGHRNVVFARRGVRTLARLRNGLGQALDEQPWDAPRPHSPDTQMLYRYLAQFDGVCASHTSATDMGTDWRDNDPVVEPVVEIYQGDRQNYERPGAPRSNSEGDSIGGWRPLGFVSYALLKGYRLGFQASSDHISTHISYCNVLVSEPSRAGVLEALKQRRVYGATDNILAVSSCAAGGRQHLMGEEFAADGPPRIRIRIAGTAPVARVVVMRDNEVVYTAEPNLAAVDFEWVDNQPKAGGTSYYYVRGEQADGELVWLSPLWIRLP